MGKVRCCRFHQWFILLLVLAVWSMVSHFFVDMFPFSQESRITVMVQQTLDNSLKNLESGHASGLHGGFVLTAMPVFASPEMYSTAGENTDSLGMGWSPPTPFRPPISL